jgi:peptidoglycan hydrolase CwlO-like protein
MSTNEEVQDMVEKFTGMLNHIRDTFVNASSLAKAVTELQEQVNKLQSDVQHYSNQITVLDEALTNRTRERDEAQATLAQERIAHNQLAVEHNNLKGEHEHLWNDHLNATSQADSLKRERDDALSEARRVNDENAELRKQLAAIQHVLKPSPEPEQPRDEVGRFASGGSW